MKRAIYLDDRERDLARRVFQWARFKCREAEQAESETSVKTPALRWFANEIAELQKKFDEPEEDLGDLEC